MATRTAQQYIMLPPRGLRAPQADEPEGASKALHEAFDDDPDWLLTPERVIERPDPRPRVRRKAK